MSKESSLHQALKIHYAGTKGRTERYIGDFICDGVSPSGELIEVQTGSFGPLQEKILTLTDRFSLRIIHPIIFQKKIDLYDEDGNLVSQRKSPKKGTPWDLFSSLIYAPLLPLNPQVTIDLIMVDVLERRIADGKGSWRRKGASIQDRVLDHYHFTISLTKLEDYYQFVPFKNTQEFSARLLSVQSKISVSSAQKTLYVLTRLNIVERVGKIKNTFFYRIKKGKSSSY